MTTISKHEQLHLPPAPPRHGDGMPDDCMELHAIALNADGDGNLVAPEWVHICPAGEEDEDGRRIVRGRDGREFEVSDPSSVIAATETPMQFDWDHESVSWFGGTRAAGWMDQVVFVAEDETDEARPTPGFWAHVERWTDRGRADVESGDYRGLSPVVRYQRREPAMEGAPPPPPLLVGFVNVALTNRPNLRMTLLHAEGAKEKPMNEAMRRLARRLGLPEDSSPEAIATAAHGQLDSLHPIEELQRRDARIAELEAEAKAESDRQHGEAVDRAITEARTSGRITPATEPHSRKMCGTPEGLASFRELSEAMAPVVSDDDNHEEGDPPAGKTLTPEEREMAHSLGVTEEEWIAARDAD